MGRGKGSGTPKKHYSIRLSDDDAETLRKIGGGRGITQGFMEVYSSYMNGYGLEKGVSADRAVVTWIHKNVRKPAAEGLREKFLILVDSWIASGFEDLSVIRVYGAIGSSKGNGAAAKRALKQLVSTHFMLLGADGRFRPNIMRMDGVARDEFDIKFEKYTSIIRCGV